MEANMAEKPLPRGTGGGVLPYLPLFFAIFGGDIQKYEGKYGGPALEIMGRIFQKINLCLT
jgi:hypothetical protein